MSVTYIHKKQGNHQNVFNSAPLRKFVSMRKYIVARAQGSRNHSMILFLKLKIPTTKITYKAIKRVFISDSISCRVVRCSISFFVFGVYRPYRECLTHMETSELPAQGCTFWPMLDTHSHWALTWGTSVYLRGPVYTPIAECLALELPLPVFTT